MNHSDLTMKITSSCEHISSMKCSDILTQEILTAVLKCKVSIRMNTLKMVDNAIYYRITSDNRGKDTSPA